MTLAQETVALVLDDEARSVLQRASFPTPEGPKIEVFVEETDDLGVWVRAKRSDGRHMVLIRWEYILSVDVPPSERKAFGLRG